MKKIRDFIKSNIKVFIGIIIGILVTSGVVYAAVLIDASDVTYTPSNSEWGVSNVSDALDDLYTKADAINPGSEYLRWDEDTKYIQVLTSNNEWKNLYYTESLPIGGKLTFIKMVQNHMAH